MDESVILTLLKADLDISTDKKNDYLITLIKASREFISREGIVLTDSYGDGILVEMYAAYLYRKRRESNPVMPRMLRWALNCRLMGGEVSTHG